MANYRNILLKILQTSANAYGLPEGMAEKAAQHRVGYRSPDANGRLLAAARACSSNRSCHNAAVRCAAC